MPPLQGEHRSRRLSNGSSDVLPSPQLQVVSLWYMHAERAVLGATIDRVWGLSKFDPTFKSDVEKQLSDHQFYDCSDLNPNNYRSHSICHDSPQLLPTRYLRFRSFRFGLPEDQKYTSNWNWRCFLATMLVCNTHETAMLAVTEKLFKVYPNPAALDKLAEDKETKSAWIGWMDRHDLRHAGKKMVFMLRANKNLIENHDSEIPEEREPLQKMNGVGRHVASITMAWVHQKPEFGIDTHVKRILKRWNYITDEMSDVEVEKPK